MNERIMKFVYDNDPEAARAIIKGMGDGELNEYLTLFSTRLTEAEEERAEMNESFHVSNETRLKVLPLLEEEYQKRMRYYRESDPEAAALWGEPLRDKTEFVQEPKWRLIGYDPISTATDDEAVAEWKQARDPNMNREDRGRLREKKAKGRRG